MCKHTATTIVACDFEGEPVAIHQCDVCGLLLPDREIVECELPRSALDDKALSFAVRHALRQTNRWFDGLMAIKQTNKAAYQAEVRRVLGMNDGNTDSATLSLGDMA